MKRHLAVLLVALLAVLPSRVSADTLSGAVPQVGGVGMAVWDGGPVASIATAAATSGCDLRSVWVFQDGRPYGYVVGAPGFVNTEFTARFGDSLAAGTFVLLACSAMTPTPPQQAGVPVLDLLLDLDDWAPGAVVADEGCVYAATVPYAARVFDGYSGYLEFEGTQVYVATSDVVLFANPASAQARVAEVVAGGYDAFIEQIALEAGLDPITLFEQYLDGAGSHVLWMGDGGIQVTIDFNDGTVIDYSVISLGRVVLEVTLLAEGDSLIGSGPQARSAHLLQLMLDRTSAAAGAIDTSTCV